MHKIPYLPVAIFLIVCVLLAGISFDVLARPLALGVSPILGDSYGFSVLGATTVTNTGGTTTQGSVGVYPGSSITGFPPGIVLPPGGIYITTTEAFNAQADNLIVFGALDQTCDTDWTGTGEIELGGMSLVPGVYCADSLHLTGVLTLTGGSAEVYIFKAATTLVTAAGSISGGDPCNIWWRVGSSATIGTGTAFIGNIFALTSIELHTGATLAGRAMVQTGAVTLDTNTINFPVCALLPTVVVPTTGPGTLVPGLPVSGGAPIRDESFPWYLVLIVGGFAAIAAGMVFSEYRRSTNRHK